MTSRSALALAMFACACHRTGGDAVEQGMIPRAKGPIVIDGHCGESSWPVSFRSPTFIDAAGRRNPTGQFRATADDDNLYIELYIADIDIESRGDVVKLDLGPLHFDVTPKGTTAPPGVRSAVDVDDTVDNAADDDEEWVAELAVPWKLLGSHDVSVRALRIDVGRTGQPHAMAWPRSGHALLHFLP